MSLNFLNNFPSSQKILSFNDPFVLIDIGARRGFHPIFNNLKSIIKIGFEPEKKECDLLNANKNNNEYYYPVALSDAEQKILFYNSKNLGASSLLKPNYDYFSRFAGAENLEITSKDEIQTTTLDNFSKSNQINDLDFMKIDTEGFDLMILKGAEEIIKNFCLGVQSEVYFNPVRENLPYFGKVHELMEEYGLNLYVLETIKNGKQKYVKKKNIHPFSYGQILFGEAIFLRDPFIKSKNNNLKFQWNIEKYKKLIFLYEIFNLDDNAYELIEFLDRENLLSKNEIKKLKKIFLNKSLNKFIYNYFYKKNLSIIKIIPKSLRKFIRKFL